MSTVYEAGQPSFSTMENESTLELHAPIPLRSIATKHSLSRRENRWYSSAQAMVYVFTKRCLDIVGAIAGLIVTVPVLAIAAIAIKWHDRGPVFFRQTRVGMNGKFFRCLKLRTMIVNAEELKASLEAHNTHGSDLRTFKMQDDPRITPIGLFLRRWSIDEFPQFWNVLCGQMSLVGPRPAVPDEVARYDQIDVRRLSVKPGLTCIWQVSGRSSLPFSEQVRLDITYIEQRGLLCDLSLIAKTIPAMINRRGAH